MVAHRFTYPAYNEFSGKFNIEALPEVILGKVPFENFLPRLKCHLPPVSVVIPRTGFMCSMSQIADFAVRMALRMTNF